MLLLAVLGGVLTILSPCILPVIPLVFSRSGRSFSRETLPMLAGLGLAFVAAALLATATARWLLVANEAGRWIALLMLAAVGVSLLSTRAAEWFARPIARSGAAVVSRRDATPSAMKNAGIGVAIGLLWAPCAGPILGLLIAAAATSSSGQAALLFSCFALGAVMSLVVVTRLGDRMLARLRHAGAADSAIRRVLGVATLATVVLLALGWDRVLFAKGGIVQTAGAEELLVRKLGGTARAAAPAGGSLDDFVSAERAALAPVNLAKDDGALPGFDGGTEWINSPALTSAALKGKVVLVDFWTFECYNCLNALPHVKELYAKYGSQGLVVIGVHTPEFARERVPENVRREVAKLGIRYPVVIDNDHRIWNAFHNQYWPAAYFADATGQLRFHHFGEGRYEEQDRLVAKLLAERDAGRSPVVVPVPPRS